MASVLPTANNSPASTTASVDASLWWDPFDQLLTELENASLSSDDLPISLVKKLKENHVWLLETVFQFKPPNQKSKEALESQQVKIGSHQLTVQPELKDTALKLSSTLCLDEVQSYILVKRSIERNAVALDLVVLEPLHLVMLQYYIERQCLLKCTRQILIHALYAGVGSNEGRAMREEALKLVSDGLESRLLTVLEVFLSSSYPEHMDIDLFTLWAEEILIEDNLVLDILFLAYYESFCTCEGKQWKKLCLLYEGMISGSCNFGKLAISNEVVQSIYQAKVQLLLILIETLDLEHLLQMIHDELPLRQDTISFAMIDIQEIDAIMSSFDALEMKEAGPLILTWAVFLCLISSLPKEQEHNVLMEIDHAGYVRQAFGAASLNYFLEILQSNILKDSDGPAAGYRSVLRTFISAFIASYEISLQLEDNNLKLILDILGQIYRGEESLCIQFWDRDSFIDGPIRCLLCNLEGEFPYRTKELVRLLSALSEGTWPAACVYNFLDKSVGLSSLLEISGNMVDNDLGIVETQLPLCVPGLEGVLIPSNTRGHVLKVIDESTALVRWEYTQSGVLVLLLRLAQEMYPDGSEEVLVTLDLLGRLVSFNEAVCYSLMETGNSIHDKDNPMTGNLEKVSVVEIICNLIKKLSSSCNGALMMSMGVNILAIMLKCSPSHVTSMVLNTNIFDVALRSNPFGSDHLSSGSWLLSGRLAKMILIDSEHNDGYCPLAVSVLEFTIQLVETGVQNDFVLALVVFSIQYVLVNHEYWKFKARHLRWKVTLKVLEVIKTCLSCIPHSEKLGEVVQDMLLCDSSIHSAIFRVVCMTTPALEKLYVSRLYDLLEIERIQLTVCSVLDILSSILSELSKDNLPSAPVFYQAVLSSTTKPVPVFIALISLISCFRNPKIQVGAAKVLSMLFITADYLQPFVSGNASFALDDKEIADFRTSVNAIIRDKSPFNEDLIVNTFKMLASAAHFQPAFLLMIIGAKDNIRDINFGSLDSTEENLLDAIREYVGKSAEFMKSDPHVLLNVLNFMKALWQGGAQFIYVLEGLKNSENFWKQLSSVILIGSMQDNNSDTLSKTDFSSSAYRYQCQSDALQIMAYEIFLQKKVLHAEVHANQASKSVKDNIEKAKGASLCGPKDISVSWCENSVLSNLIKSYISFEYDSDKYLKAKVAAALLCVHVMGKLRSGDTGSLSVSFIERINILSQKLSDLPAFSELLTQYKLRGYSDGKESISLVLSDLYYHLQGELEGRKIDHRPFRELFQFLLEFKFLESYQLKYEGDLSLHGKDIFLFDSNRLRADLGIDMWGFSEWKASKAIAETMLLYLQDINSMILLTNSKISALKALMTILPVYDEDSAERKATIGQKLPEQQIFSCIDHICQCLQATLDSLLPFCDASDYILDFLAAQAEFLLHFIRSVGNRLSSPSCILVLKTSGAGLKVLSDVMTSVTAVKSTMKLLLMMLLLSMELRCVNSPEVGVPDMASVGTYAEVSTVSLGLLPILCNCIEPADLCTLSLTGIDLILKGFLTPSTWFPIIQKHFHVQLVIKRLQDKQSPTLISVILKFFLTLARVRGGAEMLVNAGFFEFLKVLFSESSDGGPFAELHGEKNLPVSNLSEKGEKPQHIWGLGLAVVAAIVQSLGDSSSGSDVIDYVISYLFLEKSYLVSYYLNTLDFPFNVNDKKRARTQKMPTNLNVLKETQDTLILICILAKHRNSWNKAMKDMDAQLRERSIHLLAFISRGTQLLGESSRAPPILCHPILKEEFEWYKKPSFVNSRNGWFSLSPLGCGLDPRFSTLSSRTNAQVTENTNVAPQTRFSDTAAIEIYRIAFYLLNFLCLQADAATRRAEDVGFVDAAHFPELPMPDILHGLQDQGIVIVHELCEANKLKQVPSEVRAVCTLLLHITEMALYLEFCVSQICGIRPVMGRVEDFSKEFKLLLRVTEGHAFLKEPVNCLKQITSFVYPGLLQNEGFL